LAAGNVTT